MYIHWVEFLITINYLNEYYYLVDVIQVEDVVVKIVKKKKSKTYFNRFVFLTI